MHRVPLKASNFIRTNFGDCYVKDVEESNDLFAHLIYKINLISNDIIYHLEFNETGDLVSYETKPLNEDDYFDNEFYGNE